MLIIIVRMVYVGMNSSLLVEFFALIGSLCAVFITLHYFIRFAKFLHETIFIPELINEIFAALLLWLSVHIIFKLIIAGWSLILKVEAHPIFDKWGGGILALGRSAFVCSLLFFFLIISGNEYVHKMVKRSFTGFYLVDIAPYTYRGIYDGLVVKYFPTEPLNGQVPILNPPDPDREKNE